ncbi:MAG: magnesium chelatase subunit D family protein [Halanaerobiales bacterium]|nr:magnesium chelatase subunit D family protein [Halanaerobiales bacterium]
MENVIFPFSAIVGQEEVKKALILNLISPKIGGVLLCGEKGTAKSTIVRSLTQLYFGLKVVTLPLNATEDRVVGTLHIEKALKEGKKVFEPGILAEAHKNILYIDEVNLLSSSIMNTILDVASSGINRVEREGLSSSHPASFILVGSMNPEEGEIKPQLLDRFGFFVEVKGSEKVSARMEIVKKRLDFEEDPALFSERYRNEEEKLYQNILKAQEQLKKVKISEGLLQVIAELNLEAFVAGHRGDIVMAEAAKALAAYKGRDQVLLDDVKEIASLVLSHRWRKSPVNTPDMEEDYEEEKNDKEPQEENQSQEQEQNEPSKSEELDLPPQSELNETEQNEKDEKEESPLPPIDLPEEEDQIFEIGDPFKARDILKPLMDHQIRNQGSGRRSKTRTQAKMGRYVKYRLPKGKVKDIALDATLRAAAPFQRIRDKNGMAVSIHSEDIREKVREKRVGNTILFLVDVSGSMGVQKRMKAAKGAIFSLLHNAYQKRDTVGMMTFRGKQAEVVLPPTRSVDLAYKCLKELPAGGKTPLALALNRSVELMKAMRVKDEEIIPVVILISDGRTNVALKGKDPLEDVINIAKQAANEKIQFVVVDTETGFIKLGLAKKIAEELQGFYVRLEDIYDGELATTLKWVLEN